jgi:hypothetical protein
MDVCSMNRMKHINTMCVQNAAFLNVAAVDIIYIYIYIYIYQWASNQVFINFPKL